MITLPAALYQHSRQFFQRYFDGERDDKIDMTPFEWNIVKKGLDQPTALTDTEWTRIHALQHRFRLRYRHEAVFHQLWIHELALTGQTPNAYTSLTLFFAQPTPSFDKKPSNIPYDTLEEYGDDLIPFWSPSLRHAVGNDALPVTPWFQDKSADSRERTLTKIIQHDPTFCDHTARYLVRHYEAKRTYTQQLLRLALVCEQNQPGLTEDPYWNQLYAGYTRPNLLDRWRLPTPMSYSPFYDYLIEQHPRRESLLTWMQYFHSFSMARGRHPDILNNHAIKDNEKRRALYQKTYQTWIRYMKTYLQECTDTEKNLLLFAAGHNAGGHLSQKIKRTWTRHMGLLENGITLTQKYDALYTTWNVDTIIQSFKSLHDRAPQTHELFEYLEQTVLQQPMIETELHL